MVAHGNATTNYCLTHWDGERPLYLLSSYLATPRRLPVEISLQEGYTPFVEVASVWLCWSVIFWVTIMRITKVLLLMGDLTLGQAPMYCHKGKRGRTDNKCQSSVIGTTWPTREAA